MTLINCEFSSELSVNKIKGVKYVKETIGFINYKKGST